MDIDSSSAGGNPPVQFLMTKDAARRMGLSHRTLEDWRQGGGPRYLKVGRKVLYLWADILNFMNACGRWNTGGAPA